MIIADRKIREKVLYIQKKWKQLEKWSKNPKKSSETWFLQKEKIFKEMLDLPFNILKSDAELFTEYRQFREFVSKLAICNYIAERGVQLITNFIDKTQDEDQIQALLQVVEHHRSLVST